MGKITPYYGVEPSCNYQAIKKAKFNGKGFIEFKSHQLNGHSSLGFSFSTKQVNVDATNIFYRLKDMRLVPFNTHTHLHAPNTRTFYN